MELESMGWGLLAFVVLLATFGIGWLIGSRAASHTQVNIYSGNRDDDDDDWDEEFDEPEPPSESLPDYPIFSHRN